MTTVYSNLTEEDLQKLFNEYTEYTQTGVLPKDSLACKMYQKHLEKSKLAPLDEVFSEMLTEIALRHFK